MEALCDGQGRALHVKRVAEICGRRWGGERGKVDWGPRRPPDTLRDVRSSACCHTWRGGQEAGRSWHDTRRLRFIHAAGSHYSMYFLCLPLPSTLSHSLLSLWHLSLAGFCCILSSLSLPSHLRTFHTHFLISVFGNHGNKNMSSRHFSCSVLCFIYFSLVFHLYRFIWDSWNIRRLFNSPGILLIFPHFYFFSLFCRLMDLKILRWLQ